MERVPIILTCIYRCENTTVVQWKDKKWNKYVHMYHSTEYSMLQFVYFSLQFVYFFARTSNILFSMRLYVAQVGSAVVNRLDSFKKINVTLCCNTFFNVYSLGPQLPHVRAQAAFWMSHIPCFKYFEQSVLVSKQAAIKEITFADTGCTPETCTWFIIFFCVMLLFVIGQCTHVLQGSCFALAQRLCQCNWSNTKFHPSIYIHF